MRFYDYATLSLGSDDDLKLFHSGSHSHVQHNGTGNLYIDAIGASVNLRSGDNAGGTHPAVVCNMNADVELYYDGVTMFNTEAYGATLKRPSGGSTTFDIIGCEGQNAVLNLVADDGDDNADYWKIKSTHVGNEFAIQSYAGGSWETVFRGADSRNAELHAAGNKKFETRSDGVVTTGLFNGFTDEGDAQYGTNYLFHKFQQHTNNWTLAAENSNNTAPYGFLVKFSDAAPDNNTEQAILFADSGASRFIVYSDGDVWTSDAGTLTSDETLKENITDATSKLSLIHISEPTRPY